MVADDGIGVRKSLPENVKYADLSEPNDNELEELW